MMTIFFRKSGFLYLCSIACTAMITTTPPVWGQGGCGSVCIPLESLNPDDAQVNKGIWRLSISTEYGEFDNFRAGNDDITNPGGNRAIIHQTTGFLDYGLTERLNLSLMVPVIRKKQNSNRFGERVADGLGDVALFGRFAALKPQSQHGVSLSVMLGIKFDTGDIEQPGNGQPRLPPAFQSGSGAIDLIPGVTYYQRFSKYSLFGNSFLRLPTESNKFEYRFGREFEIHFGVGIPFGKDLIEFIFSADFLQADHDQDNAMILPGRLRDGTKVLNTGGTFLNLTPGIRLKISPLFAADIRFFIPAHEDWNGLPAANVGQVAPDLTSQLNLSFTF